MNPLRLFCLSTLLLAACAQAPKAPPSAAQRPELDGWVMRELPGKRKTNYSLAERGGRPCVLAHAERSVSMWRRRLQLDVRQVERLEFDWWIASHQQDATVAAPETDDAPARLLLAFDGDVARLSARNRMLFELAETVSGEAPPFATLMYVWDAKAAPETLVVSRRSDRIRKIVVGSGPAEPARWRRFERDVAADYRRAFGEEPGPLVGAAFMTDGDNTGTRAEACYGAMVFRDAQQRSLPGSLVF